jgi:hypothetical protein
MLSGAELRDVISERKPSRATGSNLTELAGEGASRSI